MTYIEWEKICRQVKLANKYDKFKILVKQHVKSFEWHVKNVNEFKTKYSYKAVKNWLQINGIKWND